jgi:phage recombination protein Bet
MSIMADEKLLVKFSQEEKQLVHNTVAKGCTDNEFNLLLYQAKVLKLDPLRKQIWAVKYGDSPALIFVGRDGFLQIAHRSGQFNGMESGVTGEPGNLMGWAKVYRKDMDHPFSVEVNESEYTTGKGNWSKMPRTMIQKVAESQALRRAFAISGVYSPEEMDESPGPAQDPVIDADRPVPTGGWKRMPPKIMNPDGTFAE